MVLSEHVPRRVKMVFQAIPPILAVVAVVFVLLFQVNANQDAAKGACNAVHQSNITTVDFIRTFFPATGPRAAENKRFLDGLAANYEQAYRDCLTSVR